MKLLAAAALAASLLVAGAAHAQSDAAPAAIDPGKLALAQRLVDGQGGEDAFRQQMIGGMRAMELVLTDTLPPEARRFGPALNRAIESEMLKTVPQMMTISVDAYARAFSTEELTYLIEVSKNPIAKSVQQKMPTLMKEIAVAMLPLIQARHAAVMDAVVREVCVEEHCSAVEQRQIADAMARAARAPRG